MASAEEYAKWIVDNPDKKGSPAFNKVEAAYKLSRGANSESAIDPSRPRINNADGSFSTERTIGIEADGRHYNIPTIVGGKQLSPDQAIAEWRAGRNRETGNFGSRQEADAAAGARSNRIGANGGKVDQIPNTYATDAPSDSPPDSRVALNAMSKGIAAVPDALLNTPTNILNLGKAAFGSAATALGHPNAAPNITPPPNYVNRVLTAAGAIGEGANPQNGRQRFIDAMMQSAGSMAANPAASVGGLARNLALGATGGGVAGATKEVTGSDTAAMAAGMLTPVAANVAGNVARNNVAAANSRQAPNAVRDQTLADAREAGYVVPPSTVNPSFINNRLESLAGKAAIKQEAAHRNQEVTNRLAVEELGLPAGTAITEGVLNNFRNQQSAPYREVAALSPLAATALQRLQQTRAESRMQWDYYNRQGIPDVRRAAEALDTRAQALEAAIDRIASRSGSPDLLQRLRESRTQIAKSFDVERALNVGDAGISAPAIGRALDRGAPLTGRLETIGRFQQGPGRQFSAEGATVPSPGVSGTEWMGAAGLGALGGATMGGMGAMAAALPLVRGPTRSLLLSPLYQRTMGSPDYSGGLTNRLLSQLPQSGGAAPMLTVNPQTNALLNLLQGQ